MSGKALPWFRLYSEAVDDEKLRLLAFEDRWHFIALLCCKGMGILDGVDSITRRKIAVKMGLDLRELGEVSRRLSEVGLIDQDSLQPTKWDDRQFRSDSSTQRVKEYRDRLKVVTNQPDNDMKRECNVTVTVQDTDTDKDIDIKPRATRLPKDWKLTQEYIDAALAIRAIDANELQRVADEFRDYWIAVPNAKGVKLDWLATWRNWVRRAKTTAAITVKNDFQFVNK